MEKKLRPESPVSAMDTAGFVRLDQAVPDVMQEIRYYSTFNFVGERVDGYEAPLAMLTREAAAALKKVSDEAVSRGMRLKVFDAYRPQRAVDHFVRWAQNLADVRMKPYFYPEVAKERLFDLGFIARQSGHSRGSTVDLTLVDMTTGHEIDMGGPFDYFGERSHLESALVSPQQAQRRRMLCDMMQRHGFAPYSAEWWHFRLRDEPFPDTYFDFPIRAK